MKQFLQAVGLICLSGLAWAQNPIPPQTVAPVSSLKTAASSASPRNRVGARYVVAKDDLLEVYVVDLQELSREYRVDGDGMITLPMLSTGHGGRPDARPAFGSHSQRSS